MKKAMNEVFPIMDIENDTLLSVTGDITVGFRMELPEIFSLSARDYEALHATWVRAMKVLPNHVIFHKQDWFTESSYQGNFEKEAPSFLSRASERFFNERPFLEHTSHIFLTLVAGAGKRRVSPFSSLLNGSLVPQQTKDPALFGRFMSAVGQFRAILEEGGFMGTAPIGEEALWSGITKTGVLERYCGLEGASSSPLLQDIGLREDLRVGDKWCRLYSLSEAGNLPQLCGPRITYDKYATDKTPFSTGFASPLGGLLNCNHIYNQYIFTGDAYQTLKGLERKRLRLQSLAAYSRANALAKEATDAFLNEALSHGRTPVKAHFNLLVWSREKSTLDKIGNDVSRALAQMDAVPKIEVVGAPQIFWAGLPGNEASLPPYELFDTFSEQATCFLNMETAYRSSRSPVGLRLGDRQSGRPLHVDISDEPMEKGICTNRNKFILGPSGSGKSFFTNHLVRSYYEQGTHVVIVDVGHSYKGLCTLVNGYYFTYEEGSPIRFNPFYLPEGESLDTEKRESIKALLLALWKKDDETFTRSEYVALSNALQGYYDHLDKNKDLFPCFNTFYEYLQTFFVPLLMGEGVRENHFDGANFLYVLRPYYRGGEFDYLLNAEENLDLFHQRFIVFELDAIKDHPILFPVVTLIIMDVFISKMRKLKGVRKMILIEEAWKAIARAGMAEYIRYLFKTVRKFFGEAVVVTQEVEDIISSPVVKGTIINNSDCKILMDQSKYINKFDAIQELLGLTEKEKTLVLSLNRGNEGGRKYKEVFISLGGTLSKVYRTEVSPEEYLTYTTEEREKMQVGEWTRRMGGDMERGIKALAQQLTIGQ